MKEGGGPVSNFKRLTGDTAREILEMAGKEDTRDNVEVLLHYTILHANEIGQPSGQDLSEAVEEHKEPPPKRDAAVTPAC
ncbi:hypothetical protein KP79_PYT06231 [Mizuhopecten yessoensis]|uniref:Uncharacterized protein n=1 Tax=Mizuhopecten yessoensis TaxID=6573 RepID=A0A210QG86_MIZYE|nr:hypothetical protein KP79_PYT06231 [Mizuhopecten yessoensis]